MIGHAARELAEGKALGRFQGRNSFMNRDAFINNAFAGEPIGPRPTARDGVFDILFCSFTVGRLDLSDPSQIEP